MDQKSHLLEQIERVLDEKVRPGLALHAGGIDVVDFDPKKGILKVKLHGSCEGCGFASETLYGFVEEELISNIPDIQGIEPV